VTVFMVFTYSGQLVCELVLIVCLFVLRSSAPSVGRPRACSAWSVVV